MVLNLFRLENYQWNPYAVPYLIAAVLMLFWGGFIFLQGARTAQMWAFMGICVTFFLWLLGTFFMYSVNNADAAMPYLYLTYAGGAFISVSLYAYASVWLERARKNKPLIVAGLAAGTCFFLLVVATEQVVFKAQKFFWGYHSRLTPFGGALFLVFFFAYLVFFFATLYQGYQQETNDVTKRQIRLVGIAFFLATLGSSDLMPSYFGIEIFPMGGLMMFGAVFTLVYTIVRYKFLDIETVIHKTLMWSGSTVIAVLPFAALLHWTRPWTDQWTPVAVTGYYLILSLIFYSYFRAVQPKLSHLFRRKRANLENVLAEFSKELVHLRNLRDLLQKFSRLLRQTVYTRHLSIYLWDESTQQLVPAIAKGVRGMEAVAAGHPFLTWLEKSDRIVIEDLAQGDPELKELKTQMRAYFAERQALVAVPFVLGGKLVGVLHLGKKDNLRKYSAAEIDFLSQLKSPLTIAFSNSLQFENVSRLYKQVQTQNARLLELDRLKSEFLANTSHELRTPIHGILGLVESILDGADGPLNEPQQKHLQMIVESGTNLKELINNLLELSRIESGQEGLQIKGFNILNVVDSVIALTESLARKKNLQFGRVAAATVPDIYGDPQKIQRVLINLVGNAIKFTEAGRVLIRIQDEPDKVRISVEDSGVGISSKDQAVIFERFRQADGSTTRRFEGTGLGLAIAREIVRHHGDDIVVQSELGRGSSFSFALPKQMFSVETAAQSAPVTRETVQAVQALETAQQNQEVFGADKAYDLEKDEELKAAIQGNGEKILIIDDNAVNREVIRTRLTLNHYQVIEAADGVEGLEKIEKENPDLVLLDLMMPRMSGFEFCKKLRDKHSAEELPVIMLTAKTEMGDKVYGLGLGANDYIAKPFNKEELIARIAVLLKIRQITRQLKRWNEELEVKVKERTQELVETQEQLIQAEKLATLGTLAGGVAHEINNPLTAVLTNAQLLKMTANSDDMESIEMIEEGAKRCQLIVQKLLKYYRKSPAEASLEPLDLSKVIQSCADMLRYQFEQENIQMEIESNGRVQITGIASELEQVVTNLFINARDAILEAKRKGIINVQLKQYNGIVEVLVRDNGIGIKKENLGKIFDPFFTTKDVGKGTGLGLAISYKILEKHNCRTAVTSEYGVGTTFSLIFNLAHVSQGVV